jgi:ABC-type transport system involved in cytochrome bd biosynthesis fused ATPase/permease subunit
MDSTKPHQNFYEAVEYVAARDVIVNKYHGCYHRMTLEELLIEHKALIEDKKKTKKAFIRHKTVPPFVIAGLLFMFAFVWLSDAERTLALTVIQVAASITLIFFWYIMETQRKSLFNAMQYQNENIKQLEAAIAVKELDNEADKANTKL